MTKFPIPSFYSPQDVVLYPDPDDKSRGILRIEVGNKIENYSFPLAVLERLAHQIQTVAQQLKN